MDGSRCISYLTIEHKEAIPEEFRGKMEDWMYGCDICQDVCPWNRFSEPHSEADFLPKDEVMKMTRGDWETLDEEAFDRLFFGSAVKRTGYEGLRRNISFVKSEK
jgi:epoxyqueuosine reductase